MWSQKSDLEHINWLNDRSKEWHCPAVVYEDAQFGTVYEPLGCTKMDVSVDCYWSTAVVSIHGEWINYLPDDNKNFIFVLKTRGSITDCTIKVNGCYVETIKPINNETVSKNDTMGNAVSINIPSKSESNKDDYDSIPKWSEKEYSIFGHSSKSYFYFPFNNVASGKRIEIDCEYIEPLRNVHGYYYFTMPLTFYDSETNESMLAPQQKNGLQDDISFEQRVKVRCRINHSNSMSVQDFDCPSHVVSKKKENSCVTIETGKARTSSEYNQGLKIHSTIYGIEDAIINQYHNSRRISEDGKDICQSLGRDFELYFRYGVGSMKMDESKYDNESSLASLISCHVINNQLRQHFNWQITQAKARETEKHKATDKTNINNNNNNNNNILDNLDTNLASLGIFMTVNDGFGVRRLMSLQPCCLYFVINGSSSMVNIWESSIIDTIGQRISRLELNDAFGICVFNEVNVRHFVSFQDELKNGGDTDVAGEFESQAHIYTMQQYQDMYGNNPDGDSWQNQLLCEVRDWLDSHAPLPRKELKKVVKDKNKQKNVNISKPLMETLNMLESNEYKKKYFKQIVFINYGKKINQELEKKEIIIHENNETKLKESDKIFKNMELAINSNDKNNETKEEIKNDIKIDMKLQMEDDLTEQELMNKISFFYSNKGKELLNIDRYTTRIYTIGLGSRTNMAFLEYLARSTRAFSAQCFDGDSLAWDLIHFLESIRAPFVTFDNTTDSDVIEFMFGKKGESSDLSFPFPIPDLYLDRPLILKYYVNGPAKLEDVIIHGSYLNDKGNVVTELAYAYVQNNEVLDNNDFPMEILLCNEEIDYWHGDYWFKKNNSLFNKYYNSKSLNNPFTIFGSIDSDKVASIIGDLSDQTGIASEFRTIVSFGMTIKKYEEYRKEIEIEKELSQKYNACLLKNQDDDAENEEKSNENDLNLMQLSSMRKRMNRRGKINNKHKAAAAVSAIVVGELGIAKGLNVYDGSYAGWGDCQQDGNDDDCCASCCTRDECKLQCIDCCVQNCFILCCCCLCMIKCVRMTKRSPCCKK